MKEIRLDNFPKWINDNTDGSKSVVELGAGFFQEFKHVNTNVPLKVGIEIYKPYIDNAKYHECVKIQGDALKYDELLTNYELDTVMIIDVLEHFEKDTGYKLIERLKKDFNKILLMLPVGEYKQDKDVTGHGGHEYQTHKSYWYVDDIEKLDFDDNLIDLNFHSWRKNEDKSAETACYFGVWNKK